MSTTAPDAELKARHRKMWASGDYPSMVTTFLLPLGPRLVEACGAALRPDTARSRDVKGYPPGIRENGGQYTHAATGW